MCSHRSLSEGLNNEIWTNYFVHLVPSNSYKVRNTILNIPISYSVAIGRYQMRKVVCPDFVIKARYAKDKFH